MESQHIFVYRFPFSYVPCTMSGASLPPPVLRLRTDQDRPHLGSAIGLRCHLQSLVSLGTQGGNDGRTGWIGSITYWFQWFHGGDTGGKQLAFLLFFARSCLSASHSMSLQRNNKKYTLDRPGDCEVKMSKQTSVCF